MLTGGNIEQAGSLTPIGLAEPESLGDLVKVGNNVFRSLGPTTVVPPQERDIRQGYLEQSGVSSIREMNVMIETTRAFEANTQLIQHQDSMVGALISRVLKPANLRSETGRIMSVQTLYTAATGMEALETKLDVIANNMANINTTAFKKDRANFEDLFYRQYRLPGALDADGNRTSTGIEVGLGYAGFQHADQPRARVRMQITNNPLDVAIEGDGFFKVTTGTGSYYTRAGNFGINDNGQTRDGLGHARLGA